MEMADRGHLRRLCEVMLTANDDFFSTTAQIIPVVILALVVEDRYVRRHALIPPKWTAFLQSAIMSVLTAGEVAALAGVLGYRNLATVALVLGVLGFSGAQLVLPIVYHNLSRATAPATTADRILTVVSTLLVDGDTTPFTVDEIEPADPDRWTQTQLPLRQDASVRKSVARSMTVHPHCDGRCTYPGFAVTGWTSSVARADGKNLGVDPGQVPDPKIGAGLPMYPSIFPAPPRVGWDGTAPVVTNPQSAAAGATAVAEITPVDQHGRPTPGWTVTTGTRSDAVDCSADVAGYGARTGDIYSCDPVAADAGTCWRAATARHMLCLISVKTHSLTELPASKSPAGPAQYEDRPDPYELKLDDGDDCFIRTGGSWGQPAGTDYAGFYGCTKAEAVWGPQNNGIDVNSHPWTVITGGQTGPLNRHHVVTTYYAATVACGTSADPCSKPGR
jgi:hypothetical protein